MPSSRSKDVKKGRAESLFANYLHHFLPRRIYIDHSFYTTEDNNPYTPDMIYYNKKTHIGCVIEIDEPYSARDLIPIHYLYDESYSNGDGIRNTYFTKRGWSVLRFAEEQVVTNPKGCLDYLIELLCYLGESGLESKLPGRSLQEVKCWTYEEASVMA